MRYLFFLFIVMPIIEMWLLIQVGSEIGAFNTMMLVLLTAAIGGWLLREQGISTLFRFNQRLEHGELPAKEIVEGLFLAVGGALLLTPGFITDAIGFACLLPFLRKMLVAWSLRNSFIVASRGSFRQGTAGQRPHQERPKVYTDRDGHTTVEGEYRRED